MKVGLLDLHWYLFRCRHGYFHIVNNLYSGWEMYAIGGSANPTINSQGNVFIASDNLNTKEVSSERVSCIHKMTRRVFRLHSILQ